MNRPAILTVVLGVACTGFMVPAFASDDSSDDPRMKLFSWDGGYDRETRPQLMKEPNQDEKMMMNRTGRGGSMMNRPVDGKRRMPNGGRKPGTSPSRY